MTLQIIAFTTVQKRHQFCGDKAGRRDKADRQPFPERCGNGGFRACGMGIELTNFHLEELFESNHVTNVLVMGEGAYYSLDQNGRRYLVAKGLLK